MPSLSELFDNGLAGVRGFGSGVSMNLVRYPAAALMVGIDQLMAANPRLSYTDALKLIREQDAQDNVDHPYARKGGELGGMLVNAVGTGGGGVMAQAGRAAAQGAVGGFTQNEGMEGALQDTVLGAGVGGIFGTAGAGVSKGIQKVGQRAYNARAERLLEESQAAKDKYMRGYQSGGYGYDRTPLNKFVQEQGMLKPQLTPGMRASEGIKPGMSPEDAASALMYIRGGQKTLPNGVKIVASEIPEAVKKEAVLIGRPKIIEMNQRAVQRAIDQNNPQAVQGLLRQPLAGEAGLAAKDFGKALGGAGGGALIGGGGGLGADLLFNDDPNDPWKYAKLGAYGGGVGGSVYASGKNLANKVAIAAAARAPVGLSETGARLATSVGSRGAAAASQARRDQEVQPTPWKAEDEVLPVPWKDEAKASPDFVPVPWK